MVDSSKVSSSRSDGQVSGLNGNGRSRRTSDRSLEGEAPAGLVESEQGNSFPGRCLTGTVGTAAEVALAQQGEKLASVGVSENVDQNIYVPEKDGGWDKYTNLTVNDSQQERLLIRNSRWKSPRKWKSFLLLPPPSSPPAPSASLLSTETQPSTEPIQASCVLEIRHNSTPSSRSYGHAKQRVVPGIGYARKLHNSTPSPRSCRRAFVSTAAAATGIPSPAVMNGTRKIGGGSSCITVASFQSPTRARENTSNDFMVRILFVPPLASSVGIRTFICDGGRK